MGQPKLPNYWYTRIAFFFLSCNLVWILVYSWDIQKAHIPYLIIFARHPIDELGDSIKVPASGKQREKGVGNSKNDNDRIRTYAREADQIFEHSNLTH